MVSEAFYFTDPEGNGIELYTDRPRSQWGFVNGEIQMATKYLDPNDYLRRHLTQEILAAAPDLAGRVGSEAHGLAHPRPNPWAIGLAQPCLACAGSSRYFHWSRAGR